ncbi:MULTISPECIES: hypothetical protein [Acidithiobacillus]|uniref:hypothetical protein n=1 Tax=Acidithiobacillus TaxID=119977 RepID=UPI0002624CCF|nr:MULTISPECIES: hypothetical protein [Acidithiobacillus]MBU2741813.1 hypothetical protein [Acidithiobacillus albertensis]
MISNTVKAFFYVSVAALGILALLGALAVIILWMTGQSFTFGNITVYMMCGWFAWSFPRLLAKIHMEFLD